MPLPKDYLEYPKRRHGMDHDLYPWSNLFARKPVEWPNGAKVALWLVPALEFFPLDVKADPFKAPGHMVTPYPDLRTYTTRDYGNRIGIFRIMKVLDGFGLKASAAVNARVAERHPFLLNEMTRRGWEIIAGGYDMNSLHYGGLDETAERNQIKKTVEILRRASGNKVTGWLSPARSESANTLHLLPEYDIEYVCDWVNDDMPYAMTTRGGTLVAMPHSNEMDDYQILVNLRHPEAVFEEEVLDAFDLLYKEAERHGGRILQLTLTPYVIGLPFRIKSLERVLGKIMEREGVWPATGAEILESWKAQQ